MYTQTVRFVAGLHSITTSFAVDVKGRDIPAGGTDTWTNVPLQVPSVMPSRLDGCRIIDISYRLTVSLILIGLYFFLFITFLYKEFEFIHKISEFLQFNKNIDIK